MRLRGFSENLGASNLDISVHSWTQEPRRFNGSPGGGVALKKHRAKPPKSRCSFFPIWSGWQILCITANKNSTIWWPHLQPMHYCRKRHLVLTDINLKWFWLKKISQVMDSIPWVRCASGNVSFVASVNILSTQKNQKASPGVEFEYFRLCEATGHKLIPTGGQSSTSCTFLPLFSPLKSNA